MLATNKKAAALNICLYLLCFGSVIPALAGPSLELGSIVAGDVSIDNTHSQMTNITQGSSSAIVDWRSFSIAEDEAVNFNQPSAASVILNRVTGSNESQILGHLSANGQVFLVNPNGILFGHDSTVDVAGILATTSDIDNEDFLAGRYDFASESNLVSHVVNQGTITAHDGGLVALVAPGVENSGTIHATMGRVNLSSGTVFTVDLYGDQLIHLALDNSLSEMAEDAMDSFVNNSGAIYADGGRVVLDGHTAARTVNGLVNMSGVIQAHSIEEVEGQILLTGGNIQITGQLAASGQQPGESGGTVEVFGESIRATEEAFLDVSGTESGGFIEMSAATVNIDVIANLKSTEGSGGTLLIDPIDLVIDTVAGTDVVTVSTIESALASGGDFVAEAEESISVNASIDTSAQATSGTLSLNDENSDGVLTVNLNQQIVLGANQSLNGEAHLVNVADGTSIQNGIDVSNAGATINVANGAYTENVVIDKSVTLNGAQVGVDARDRSADESILTGSISIESAVSNVVIDGMSIAEGAPNSGSNAGIVIKHNATDISIQNTIFSRSGDVDGDTYRGIVTFFNGNQTGLLIQNNQFSGWATGIFLNPKATGAQILNNDFDGNFVGVSVDGPDGTVISGNLFANSVFEGLGIGPGEDNRSATLSANQFEGNTTHIGLYTDMEIDASSNIFEGTSASSMTIEQLLTVAEKIGDATSSTGGYSGLVSLRDDYVLVTNGQSINNAIDLASIGDTVAVGAGTYNEAVTVDKSITLGGFSGALISLDGSLPLSRIVNITADNATVEGFSIEGGGTHVGIAIPGQNATVSNNQISNVLTGIQTNTLNTEGNNQIINNRVTNSGYGISLQNNSNTVTGNTLDVETEGFGIGSSGNIITGNNLSIGSDGIHLQTYSLAPLPGADIDLLVFLNDNQFDRALYITDGSSISVQTIFGNVQGAIDAASVDETVNMLDGTYSLDSTLDIDKAISLAGESEANTIIDASAVSGYGLYITADNVDLNNFTVYGPSANAGNSYGIKVNPDTSDAADRLMDFSIANVSIRGSGRAELDLNGVYGALITSVTADGRSLADSTLETAGAGIQITDSADITLTNVNTLSNAWGGVALYQANRFYDQQTINITINAASNAFSESAGLFSQDSSDSLDFGTLNLTGFNHTVRNVDFRSDGNQFTFYLANEQAAIDFALSLDSPFSSVIQGWGGAENTNDFTVGTSSSGVVMSITDVAAAAPNDATINVAQGVYDEALLLDGDQVFIFDNATVTSLSAEEGSVIELGGSLKLSSLSFLAAIDLVEDLTISADQNVALNSVDGAHSLSLAASSVELSSAGTSTPLSSISVQANSITLGSISASGAHSYEGALVLNGGDYIGGSFAVIGDTVLTTDATVDTSSSNGSISFSGEIDGTAVGQQDLFLNAGTGSVTHGNLGQSIRLGDLVITAGDYDGSIGTSDVVNLTVNAGDIDVGNSTVNALGLVSMSGDSITGTINANEVELQAEETVSATISADEAVSVSAQNITDTSISAETIDIEASENIEVNLNATQTANVSATNVSNSFIDADQVTISVTDSVEVEVNATSEVVIQADTVNASVSAPAVSIEAEQSIELAGDIDNLVVASEGDINISAEVETLEFGAGSNDITINGTSSDSLLDSSIQALDTLFTVSVPDYPDTNSPAYVAFTEDLTDSPFETDFEIGSLANTQTGKAEKDSDEDDDENENHLNKFLQGSWSELTKQPELN